MTELLANLGLLSAEVQSSWKASLIARDQTYGNAKPGLFGTGTSYEPKPGDPLMWINNGWDGQGVNGAFQDSCRVNFSRG